MQPLRYVVLHHEGVNKPHFDLMFEIEPGGELRTWRSPEWPVRAGTILQKLPDHRQIYLEYEGEIAGNRGHVRRIARGCSVPLTTSKSEFHAQLDQLGEICFKFSADDEWQVELSPHP